MHLRLSMAAIVLALGASSAQAQPAGDLFRGSEITILIGAGAGGGADTYARLLARHFGRHLPGNPSVVAKNMPGAGGLRLANHIFNVAAKDGSELGIFLPATALEPLFGNPGAKFETAKFSWIGNMDSDATVCYAGRQTGIKTWQDLKNRRETTFGASGPSSTASIQTKVTGELLGVKTRMIHGYQGTRTSLLAIQRGELDGACGIYMSTVRSQFAREVESGDAVVWIVADRKRVKEFPQVPTIFELVKTDADRNLAELIFGQNPLARPIVAPPGLSPERTAALRKGLMAALADPALLAEARKTKLEITPMSGEDTQRNFQAFYALPRSVVDRAKAIVSAR
jgi:tripartite-type tricarboxylate transporter receptor subunit TctC